MLTRDQILAVDDRPSEKVSVPEWGGDVYVKTYGGDERDSFEQSIIVEEKTNLIGVRAKLCVRCVVDESGVRLFSDEDATLLGKKNAAAVNRVFEVAQRLNKLLREDVEELIKNSGTGLSAGST